MNAPFPFRAPYLTDPDEYAAHHRDQSEQALADCIAADYRYLTTQPCTHYHGRHATFTRCVERAA